MPSMNEPAVAEKTKPAKSGLIPHSISAANTYRQCPRLYYNRYVLGWKDAQEASWLTYGTKIDKLLEIIDLSNVAVAISRIPEFFTDPFDQMDAEVLLSLFAREFAADPLPPVDLLGKQGNQYPFYINFNGNPVTGMLSMVVSGKIDKVTIIDGEIGVMEGKTTSKPIDINSVYWKKLPMDPQIACYVWGLSKELGRPVNWVWYQVIRRPSSEAHPMFKRTYIKDKVSYPYTEAEYRTRVFSILHGELSKPLVARRKLFIEEARKDLWLTEHAQTYQEIQAKKEHQRALSEAGMNPELAWPRNHMGCDNYGGCPFWDSCIGKTTIETSGKFIRREHESKH